VEARLLPLKQIPPRSCGDEKGKIMKNFFKFLKSDSFCDYVMMGGMHWLLNRFYGMNGLLFVK
jgi:hypothetical protein